MEFSRRVALGVLAAGLWPGKPRAAGAGLERLQVHDRSRPAPAFMLRDADGAEVMAEAFAGQGVVLNFWATWCPPCIEEMPALERLHAALAADRIVVVAASQDRGGVPVVQGFYDRVRITGLPIWLDPRGAAARAFGARGLPTTVILDREGRELARLEGAATWDSAAAIAELRRLVPRRAPAPETAAT
jgi:thiol-disulfide isomerase/thioredoxin